MENDDSEHQRAAGEKIETFTDNVRRVFTGYEEGAE
jgi:hypothetical protein